jgi:hypothetical protein
MISREVMNTRERSLSRGLRTGFDTNEDDVFPYFRSQNRFAQETFRQLLTQFSDISSRSGDKIAFGENRGRG